MPEIGHRFIGDRGDASATAPVDRVRGTPDLRGVATRRTACLCRTACSSPDHPPDPRLI